MNKILNKNTFITYIIENNTDEYFNEIGFRFYISCSDGFITHFKIYDIPPKTIKKKNIKISRKTYPFVYEWSNAKKPKMNVFYTLRSKNSFCFDCFNILKKIKKNYIGNECIIMPPKIINIIIKHDNCKEYFCEHEELFCKSKDIFCEFKTFQ